MIVRWSISNTILIDFEAKMKLTFDKSLIGWLVCGRWGRKVKTLKNHWKNNTFCKFAVKRYNRKFKKNGLQNEEQNILVSMLGFASIFGRFWTDFGTQNRWKIDAQSDAKSSIEKSRAQKGQKPSNRGLADRRNLSSEAPGRSENAHPIEYLHSQSRFARENIASSHGCNTYRCNGPACNKLGLQEQKRLFQVQRDRP